MDEPKTASAVSVVEYNFATQIYICLHEFEDKIDREDADFHISQKRELADFLAKRFLPLMKTENFRTVSRVDEE